MKSKLIFCIFLFSIAFSCTNDENFSLLKNSSSRVAATAPALTGKIVYHTYVNYGDAAKMYIYNFNTNTLTWISQNWNLHDPINGHFNFDGTKLVFMAQAVPNGKWDIYLWDVGSSSLPTNLTANDNCRDEDPKFSPNGYRICFKQTPSTGVGNLKIMELNGVVTNSVTNNTIESGMPYYSDDATALIYARGAGSTSNIYLKSINAATNKSLASVANVQEYYPIVLGPSTFVYTRWVSASDKHDQIYLGYFANSTRTKLPFNTITADYSDAFPCGSNKLLLSSNKSGGAGAYDLYIADSSTGAIWSLSTYNTQINSGLNELGVAYSAM